MLELQNFQKENSEIVQNNEDSNLSGDFNALRKNEIGFVLRYYW